MASFANFINALRAQLQTRYSFNQKEHKTRNKLREFVEFWEPFLKINPKKYFYCYYLSPKKKTISIEVISIDPRQSTLPVFLNSYACVNLTGTVDPYIYANLTGLNKKSTGYTEIIASSPFKSENIEALIVDGVSTKAGKRTPEMYQKIIQKISEVVSSTPANIGIFCASYKILNELSMNGIAEMSRKHGKKLFVESPIMSASENFGILNEFKKCASQKGKGAVLLGVCGGRNSEGESYPGNFMNAVIIVGIPYHRPTLRTGAKIAYYNRVFNNQGWLFAYVFPAFQRANQAAGRPIRKEEDKGAIIFLDSRFKDKKGLISDWIRKEIKVVPDKEGIIYAKLRAFWS